MTITQPQRRGRRKSKPLTDKAWISLFKYNARALRLRAISASIMMKLVAKYGVIWFRNDAVIRGNDDRIMYSDFCLILEYWHSSLEIVLETYEKYGLNDQDVDKLLNLPLRKELKRFRNNSFHFREDYSDSNVFSFFRAKGSFEWVTSLQDALLKYLEVEEQRLRERSGIEIKKVVVFTR